MMGRRSSSSLVPACLLIHLATSEALSCFQCEGDSSSACGARFGHGDDGGTQDMWARLVDCARENKHLHRGTVNTHCYKIIYHGVGRDPGKTRYKRGCGWTASESQDGQPATLGKDEEWDCTTYDGSHDEQEHEVCLCADGDGCNGGIMTKSVASALVFSSTIFVAIRLL